MQRWQIMQYTILTEMMADEFNLLRPEIKNYKAEADADLIPIPGQLELHGRCRCGVLLSACFCALFVAELIVGMEELELHYRRRGRSNFRKIKIATISVRIVSWPECDLFSAKLEESYLNCLRVLDFISRSARFAWERLDMKYMPIKKDWAFNDQRAIVLSL